MPDSSTSTPPSDLNKPANDDHLYNGNPLYHDLHGRLTGHRVIAIGSIAAYAFYKLVGLVFQVRMEVPVLWEVFGLVLVCLG